jgi:hypothetical protein
MTTRINTQTNSAERTVVTYARLASLIIAIMVLAFGLTVGVLGAAINWPSSLQDPANKVLPLISQQRSAVNFGYSMFMLSSLLLIPLALLVRQILDPKHISVLLANATIFGILAALAKTIGIVRWFFVMPFLADSYNQASNGSASQDSITLIYSSFNAYFDKFGSDLGDLLFSGIWTAMLCLALLRLGSSLFPRWLSWSGLAVAALLIIGFGAVFGLPVEALLSIATSLWAVWMVAFAIVLFRASLSNRATRLKDLQQA